MGVSFIACDLERAVVFRTDKRERMICRDENGESAWVMYNDTNQLLSSFDYSLLDPVVLSGFFGAGFTLVGFFAILGKVLSVIMQSIKRG